MAVKIRLKRVGRKKLPIYRIVVSDSRKARDGKCIEEIGTYNPLKREIGTQGMLINEERLKHWFSVGAQSTDVLTRLFALAGLAKAKKHVSSNQNIAKKDIGKEPEAPKEEAKAEEAPKEEAKVEEAPKEEAKAEEAPKEEAKAEAPKEEAKAEEAPKEEAKAEAPKEEAKVEEAPKEEAKVEEAPKEEAKVEEAPKEEAKAEAPKEEA